MSKVSVLIPARKERFLPQTINDLLTKAAGDVEVIAVLDGDWPDPPLDDDPRLKLIHFGQVRGMRAAINAAASLSTGKYLMKCDAHCMFAPGYDQILSADCDDNWMVIPARYSLDPIKWDIDNNGKPRRDYHYLCYPDPNKDHDGGMHGVEWWERGKQRLDPKYDIDDNMSFQGSCWFMHRTWFHDFLGGMSEVGYGTFTQEPQEIGLKTWLGGGAIKVNKKVWYAHLHKGKTFHVPGSRASNQEIVAGHNYSAHYWMNNLWDKRVHDIEWLIDKFWPVPTWPPDKKDWTAWKDKEKANEPG